MLLTVVLTNSVEQRLWEAENYWAGQQVPLKESLSSITTFCTINTILSQLNTLTPNLFKLTFNIILLTLPCSPKLSLMFTFLEKNFFTFIISLVCYIPYPSYPLSFHHPIHILGMSTMYEDFHYVILLQSTTSAGFKCSPP